MARRTKNEVERIAGDRIERNCTRCGLWKGLREFSNSKRPDGAVYKHSACYSCLRLRMRGPRLAASIKRVETRLAASTPEVRLEWLAMVQRVIHAQS